MDHKDSVTQIEYKNSLLISGSKDKTLRFFYILPDFGAILIKTLVKFLPVMIVLIFLII